MKLYATIETPAKIQKIFVEDRKRPYTKSNSKIFYVCNPTSMNEYYGDPEKYISNVLERAARLNRKVVIKR